jgi:hypothetical protein
VTIIARIIKAVVMNVIDIDVVDDYFHGALRYIQISTATKR